MPDTDLSALPGLAQRQRAAFATGRMRDANMRVAQLRRFRRAVTDAESRILAALASDLGKPTLEAYGSDIAPLLSELDLLIRHTGHWSRPRRVGTPLLIPGSSFVHPEPYGAVLVMAPWNYPLQLALVPAVGAIAAGNHVTIKPSELSPATAAVIADLVAECFEPDHVTVVTGGVEHARALLAQKWDYLFFTGGTKIGRIIMTAAAENLTPLTLELGGKNPCIVTEHADIAASAKRIAWGKFFNAGQTCVAPDYVLVHRSIKQKLIDALAEQITRFYGTEPKASEHYARIVNEGHLSCLVGMLDGEHVVIGGHSDATLRYLAPTVVDDVSWDSPLMRDEIFGPILPLLAYDDLDDAFEQIGAFPNPLTAYLFSRDRAEQRRALELAAGAVVLNDTLLHFTNPQLPFGGVGDSGMGKYHGRRTFFTFTHEKAVLKRRVWPRLLGVRWPPYWIPMPLIKVSLKWFG